MLFRVFGFSGPGRRRVEGRSAREKGGAQWPAGEESQAGLHDTDVTRKPQRAQQFEAMMMAPPTRQEREKFSFRAFLRLAVVHHSVFRAAAGLVMPDSARAFRTITTAGIAFFGMTNKGAANHLAVAGEPCLTLCACRCPPITTCTRRSASMPWENRLSVPRKRPNWV